MSENNPISKAEIDKILKPEYLRLKLSFLHKELTDLDNQKVGSEDLLAKKQE